jgi:ubiquinone/menaquinone biosynthesis C-methylase UbiE
MIARARQEMPSANLFVSEAVKLPFPDNSMDLVFSYSVFCYFEDWGYAGKVLDEMYRVAKHNAVLCIWDVPDVKKKDAVESFRGKAEAGYEHTYYDMNEFIQWFLKKDIKRVWGGYRLMPFYQHSNFRFNITVEIDKE